MMQVPTDLVAVLRWLCHCERVRGDSFERASPGLSNEWQGPPNVDQLSSAAGVGDGQAVSLPRDLVRRC